MPVECDEPTPPGLDAGYDAVLVVSFGGPEGPDDVLPFLERVTAGRGIPAERLVEVGRHYFALGGVSPINEQNRALVGALRTGLAELGVTVPVVLGNRHSAPFIQDSLLQLSDQGCRRVLAVATSAFSSYSGCRQYREDLAAGAQAAGVPDLALVKLAPFWQLPGFVDAVAAQMLATLRALPPQWPSRPEILFTTHSIPVSQSNSSGPADAKPKLGYTEQHLQVASRAMARVQQDLGWPEAPPHQLVFQSRSGPPQVPWLEPDVNDALESMAARGVGHVVIVPIGFLSDHMEVVWDLDTQAKATADALGVEMVRVPTVGTHPHFVSGMSEAIAELVSPQIRTDPPGWQQPTSDPCDQAERAATPLSAADRADVRLVAEATIPCGSRCCPNPRGPRPNVPAVFPRGGFPLWN